MKNGDVFILESPYTCQGGLLALGLSGNLGLFSDWLAPMEPVTGPLIGRLVAYSLLYWRFVRISFA